MAMTAVAAATQRWQWRRRHSNSGSSKNDDGGCSGRVVTGDSNEDNDGCDNDKSNDGNRGERVSNGMDWF
jgi:hypothetical protein